MRSSIEIFPYFENQRTARKRFAGMKKTFLPLPGRQVLRTNLWTVYPSSLRENSIAEYHRLSFSFTMANEIKSLTTTIADWLRKWGEDPQVILQINDLKTSLWLSALSLFFPSTSSDSSFIIHFDLLFCIEEIHVSLSGMFHEHLQVECNFADVSDPRFLEQRRKQIFCFSNSAGAMLLLVLFVSILVSS